MKRLFSLVLLIFLLSLSSGCALSGTPSAAEDSKASAIEEMWREPIKTQHFYNIDGKRQNVGDYTTIERGFLSRYNYDGKPIEQVYDTDRISYTTITHRKGKVICERCIGIVTDGNNGDGRILNTSDEVYNYISYRFFDQPYKTGTVVITYLVYSPYNNYEDDIIDRYDFVLTREFERE